MQPVGVGVNLVLRAVVPSKVPVSSGQSKE